MSCLYRVFTQQCWSSRSRWRSVFIFRWAPGSLEGWVGPAPPSPSPPAEVGARRGVVPGRGLGGVHVGLLLGLGDVPLVPDPLVTEPVAHLKQGNHEGTMTRQWAVRPAVRRSHTSWRVPPSPPRSGRDWRGWRKSIHLKFLEMFCWSFFSLA